MNYVLDMHTHTVASGHAYSSISEMADAAKAAGLELLGITEHAPTMPGTCHDYYFHNYRIVDRNMYAVPLYLGVELNILDETGKIDLDTECLKTLDHRIASLHLPCFHSTGKKECTRAVVHALENPLIDIIGHPDDARLSLDYQEVVKAARDNNKILEVNNSSLLPTSFRPGARANYIKMLALCEQYGVHVIANSDAHISTSVGDHSGNYTLLEELNFPEELVLNTSVKKFKQALHR